MKKINLRFGAALLAIVMCFGLLAGCGKSGITLKKVQKDPYAAMVAGYEKYTDALEAKYGKAFDVFDKLSEGVGTYSAKLSVPEGGDIDISAVVDAKNGAYSAKASAGAMGVTMDASLWGDKNNIALSVPALLGNGTYGVKLDTLETDLEGSALLKSLTGGMSLDDIKGALESEAGIKWDDLKGMLSADKLTEAMNKYTSDMEAFMKGKTYTVAEESFKVGETDVPAISVAYTLTADDYKKIMDIYAEMLDSQFGSIFTAAGIDIKDEIESVMSEDGINEFLGDSVSGKIYLGKKTGAVVAVVTEAETLKATVCFGEDVSKKLDMSFDVEITADGETVGVNAALTDASADGKSGFELNAAVTVDGEEHKLTASALRNDADSKFEAKATVDGEEMGKIAGKLTYSAEEFTVTVDSVTAGGETTDIGLTVSAKLGGTVEAVPEYTNIITASEEDVSGILEALGSIGSSLGGMSSGGFDSDLFPGGMDEGSITEGGEKLTIEDLYGDMTDEEIEQFLKDLEDLGMTTDDILDLLYS